MMTRRRPNRHPAGVLHQAVDETTGETTIELGVDLEVPLAAVRTHKPATVPHQSGTPAAHLQVTDPLAAPVPHIAALEPTMRAPRPLPGRFDLDLQAVNRINQHPPHANTRQVQTNGHNIRHRGLPGPANWYFTDSSEASPPIQGFHPPHPTFSRRARLFDRWPMVVKRSDRVEVEWFKQVSPISNAADDEIAVSGIGTIAAARAIPQDGAPFIAVSMYARWIAPHRSTNSRWRVGYADGSAHRIISDLSAFIGSHDPSTHRILAAGDLNMVFSGKKARESTVLDRMDALGFERLGPQYPAGRRANPTPESFPAGTRNVPTYHTTRQSPETATKQLDWAFTSRGFHHSISVSALNSVEDWGPSDHCRLLIEIADE